MLVSRSELVKLLGTIGVPDAGSWPVGKLSVRVNEGTGITKFLESPEQVESLKSSQDDLDLYDKIYAHQFGGGTVEVVDDVEPEVRESQAPPATVEVVLVNSDGSEDHVALESGDSVVNGIPDLLEEGDTPLEPTPLQTHHDGSNVVETPPLSGTVESDRLLPVDRSEERASGVEGLLDTNLNINRDPAVSVIEAPDEEVDRVIEEIETEFDDEINELFSGTCTEPELLIPPPQPKPKRKYVRRKPLKAKKRKKGVYRVGNKDMTWDEMVAHYDASPLPVPTKGVAYEIVRILKEAGQKDSCVTKAQLVRLLGLKFPKKTEKSLTHTVNNHVPTRLRMVYGLYVWKKKVTRGPYAGKWGHFLNGRGKTPQPGAKKRKKYGSV